MIFCSRGGCSGRGEGDSHIKVVNALLSDLHVGV